MLSFFPRDVLDEILNLIESVSEGFPTYSLITKYRYLHFKYRYLYLKYRYVYLEYRYLYLNADICI